MKRHLFSLSPLEGILVACSALAVLAFVPSTTVVADHVPPDPSGIFAVHNGDADADGMVAINDAIYIMNYLYAGGPRPRLLACEPFTDVDNGDVNGSRKIDLSDAIYLLNWLFAAGRPPVEPCLGAGG